MQKKNLSAYIAFGLGTLFVATAAFAYREPLSSPTGNNAFGYITKGAETGVKDGGLSVYTFTAAQDSILKDQTIFSGAVFGGTTATSTLKFGDSTHGVSGEVAGNTRSTGIQSDTLKNTTKQHICGDSTGGLILCP